MHRQESILHSLQPTRQTSSGLRYGGVPSGNVVRCQTSRGGTIKGNGDGTWSQTQELGGKKKNIGTDDTPATAETRRSHRGIQNPQWTHENRSDPFLGSERSSKRKKTGERAGYQWAETKT